VEAVLKEGAYARSFFVRNIVISTFYYTIPLANYYADYFIEMTQNRKNTWYDIVSIFRRRGASAWRILHYF
jgi:hypothetical protein